MLPTKFRGFSLVELMIGMTLGLIGMLIVTQVVVVSSGYRSATMAAGEAQSIGNLSLYTIERDVRQAGFGIVSTNLLNCGLVGYNSQNLTGSDFAATLRPVTITDTTSADGVSDTLSVSYATGDARMSQVLLSHSYAGGDDDVVVQNRFGFRENDFFLIAEAGKSCVLGQVSELPSGSADTIVHGGSSSYNKAGGLGVSFNANVGEVYSLGSSFVFNTYAVNANHELEQTSLLTGQTMTIADNVLAFKAMYGHDSDGDGTIDTWDRTPPSGATAADTSLAWQRGTNIRIGVAVKSPKRERSVVSVSPIVMWPGGPTVTLSAEDQHYRYRVYNALVPLRNLIWNAL